MFSNKKNYIILFCLTICNYAYSQNYLTFNSINVGNNQFQLIVDTTLTFLSLKSSNNCYQLKKDSNKIIDLSKTSSCIDSILEKKVVNMMTFTPRIVKLNRKDKLYQKLKQQNLGRVIHYTKMNDETIFAVYRTKSKSSNSLFPKRMNIACIISFERNTSTFLFKKMYHPKKSIHPLKYPYEGKYIMISKWKVKNKNHSLAITVIQ